MLFCRFYAIVNLQRKINHLLFCERLKMFFEGGFGHECKFGNCEKRLLHRFKIFVSNSVEIIFPSVYLSCVAKCCHLVLLRVRLKACIEHSIGQRPM